RREVMDIGAGVVGVHRRLGATLARLDSAVRVGQPLPLQPMLETEAIQPHMWQTAMQSGALDLLDVATVWRLSEFYNELSVGTQQLHRLGELSETVLLPVAGAPAEEFWRPAAGLPSGGPSAAAEPPTGGPPAGAPQPRYRLQPRYQWYTATLGELYETTGTIVAQSDSLARLLAPPGRR
ncbi:MAG TPA: hypothetical protein VFS08_21285, partial [Gemmatimonadaceae bacterium]|nr:hypothetical protein [Gemmatimonadaceae bacterium]